MRRWSEGLTRSVEERMIQTWAGTSPEGLGSMGTHPGAQEEQGERNGTEKLLILTPCTVPSLTEGTECDPWLCSKRKEGSLM